MAKHARRRTQISNSDLIRKVLITIEYLKLCADHQVPTGDSIPLDITIMPDLVVDVDGAAIRLLNESTDKIPGISAATVGARAGRVLSILAHLRDRDDEGFRLHYIAKTGQTGRTVLQEQLQRHLAQRGLEPLTLPYLVPSAETRFAVLGRKSYKELQERHITEPKSRHLLEPSELHRHFYNPLPLISKSNAIYFATDSIAQFEKLIDIAVVGDTTKAGSSSDQAVGCRYVFIDLAAIHFREPDRAEPLGVPGGTQIAELTAELTQRAKDGDSVAQRTRLIVIVNEPDLAQPGLEARKSIWEQLGLRSEHDFIMYYRGVAKNSHGDTHGEKPCIVWFDGMLEDEIDINPSQPDVRDAFVAGLILYCAVASAWSSIPGRERLHGLEGDETKADVDWTRGLFPDPYGKALTSDQHHLGTSDVTRARLSIAEDGPWPIKEGIQLGCALARLSRHGERHDLSDARSLLLANSARPTAELGDQVSNLQTLVVGNPESQREWCKQVMELEARFSGAPNSPALAHLLEHLRGIINKARFVAHPNNWRQNRTKIVKLSSWDTMRVMIAVRASLRLRSLHQSGTPFFEKDCAYLTDLDGTLLQSSGLRSSCLERAFLTMLASRDKSALVDRTFPVVPHVTALFANNGAGHIQLPEMSLLDIVRVCNRLYDACVYKPADECWKRILSAYKYYNQGTCPRDFRQVWNHRLSYPVFVWVLWQLIIDDPPSDLPESPVELVFHAMRSSELAQLLRVQREEEHKAWKVWAATFHTRLIDWFGIAKSTSGANDTTAGENAHLDAFYRQLANIELRYNRDFEQMAKRYWNVDYEPIRHSRQCLRALQDVLGVRLYVTTEGHHETQLKKLEVLGLDRFFPEMMVMSTQAAASTHEDSRNIEEGIQRKSADEEFYVKVIEDEKRRRPGDPTEELMRLRDKAREEREHLQRYAREWTKFEDKSAGTIYPLIIASVIVEPETPFIRLTNLGQLVAKLGSLSTDQELYGKVQPVTNKALAKNKKYFAMVGDRESKDIKPIIKSCGGTSNTGRRRDRVTTVRLVTLDHKNEDLYWRDEAEAPHAHYVAWTAVQSLLCLSREDAWKEPMDYHAIPPIVDGRLADQNGTIDDRWLRTLVWGHEERNEAFVGSLSVISFLVLRSTMREMDFGMFINNVQAQLDGSRTKDPKTYDFMWHVIERITFEAKFMSQEDQRSVGTSLRQLCCREFKEVRRGPLGHTYGPRIVNILEDLAGSASGGALCAPPTIAEREAVTQVTQIVGEKQELNRIFQIWEFHWAQGTS